jgi:hypothetical protein
MLKTCVDCGRRTQSATHSRCPQHEAEQLARAITRRSRLALATPPGPP